MQIKTLISPDIIRVPLAAEDRLGAIRELIELIGEQGLVSDVEAAIKTTWAREQERTTGIGEGLAVPHGRCDCVDSLALAIGKPATPIDFQSFDQKPVRLIVLVLSPPDDTRKPHPSASRPSKTRSRSMSTPTTPSPCTSTANWSPRIPSSSSRTTWYRWTTSPGTR